MKYFYSKCNFNLLPVGKSHWHAMGKYFNCIAKTKQIADLRGCMELKL